MMKPKVRAIEVLIITLADIIIYIVKNLVLAIASAMAAPKPQPTKETKHHAR